MVAVDFDKQTHTYLVGGIKVPSVTQVLKDMGFYGDAVKYFTDYSRDRGTFIHDAIRYHVEDCLDEEGLDPALRPYLDAWYLFEHDTGFISEACETPLASMTCMFAGTPDHIGHLNGHAAVLDVKSGAMNPAAQIQTAAYDILIGSPRIERFGLYLKNNGKYKLEAFTDRQDKNIFKSALACWHWQKNNKLR